MDVIRLLQRVFLMFTHRLYNFSYFLLNHIDAFSDEKALLLFHVQNAIYLRL